MKVCTDACLFGAWAAEKIRDSKSEIQNVLDIGTGTGLLSLMLAQKNQKANIDAVEIDEAASQQANENFEASPWKEKLNVYNTSIQQFTATRLTNKQINQLTSYDLIISNPPFFGNDLKSENKKRNLALHSLELSFEELIEAAVNILNGEGMFVVLLPYHRTDEFMQLAKRRSFYVHEKISVKQTSKHNYFRSMLWLSKKQKKMEEDNMIIQKESGEYTDEFIDLLKDYYLYL